MKRLLATLFLLLTPSLLALPAKNPTTVHEQTAQQGEPLSKVMLIHGTFARRRPWFQPSGKFYEQLKSQNIMIIPFTWSGSASFMGRIKAAKRLTTEIIKHPNVTVIAHSHGSNVFNLATQFIDIAAAQNENSSHLDNRIKEISSGIYAATFEENIAAQKVLKTTGEGFVQKLLYHSYSIAEKLESMEWIANKLHLKRMLQTFKEHVANVKEIVDMIDEDSQTPDSHTLNIIYTMITDAINETKELLKNSEENNDAFLIKHAFLLGCPVREEAYVPSKNIVRSVYNLYSHGDLVQRVLGMYNRTFSQKHSGHITNLSMSIEQQGSSKLTYPGHLELHSNLLGAEILAIPDKIDPLVNRQNLRLEMHEDTSPSQIIPEMDPLIMFDATYLPDTPAPLITA